LHTGAEPPPVPGSLPPSAIDGVGLGLARADRNGRARQASPLFFFERASPLFGGPEQF
jgi:hypothetical protein